MHVWGQYIQLAYMVRYWQFPKDKTVFCCCMYLFLNRTKMTPTKNSLFYYRSLGANQCSWKRAGSVLCNTSCDSKTNRIPHHHPCLLDNDAVIMASGYLNQWSKGKGHTHIVRGKPGPNRSGSHLYPQWTRTQPAVDSFKLKHQALC